MPLLATGGTDNKVKVWKARELELVLQIDLMNVPTVGSPVAVAMHASGEKVLVATTAAELYELSALPPPPPVEGEEAPAEDAAENAAAAVGAVVGDGPLVVGPSGTGVASLSAGPDKILTVGVDGAVTAFDLAGKLLAREVVNGATVACLSPDGNSVLVGLSKGYGVVFALADGALTQTGSLRPPGSEPPAEEQDAEAPPAEPVEPPAPVACCAWADVGLALACGSVVHLFSADLAVKGSPAPLSADVVSMDFAEGSPLLQVQTDDLDLTFVNGEDGSIVSPSDAKDAVWKTTTCSCSYGAKGVFSSLATSGPSDGVTIAAAPSLGLCAAGDRFGAVSLLHYPCLEKSGAASFCGHAPGIAGIAFCVSGDAPMLFTAGNADGVIFKWNVDVDEKIDEADAAGDDAALPADEDEEDKPTWVYDAAADENLLEDAEVLDMVSATPKFKATRRSDVEALYALEDAATTAEDGVEPDDATAPWKDAVSPPTNADPYLGDAVPCDDLALAWVHGYSGQGQRSNVRYAESGEIVYPAACFGVVLDKTAVAQRETRTQKIFGQHSDGITALATTIDGSIAATGQIGESVEVWSTLDCSGVACLKLLPGSRACSALAFSADGAYVAAAAQDDAHTLHVFSVDSGRLVAAAPTGSDKILCLAWNGSAKTICFGATNSFGLASLDGRSVYTKKGIYGPSAKRQAIFCCGFVEDAEGAEFCVVGTASGYVYKLEGRTLAGGEKHHRGPVTTLSTSKSIPAGEDEKEIAAVVLVTGGYDGKVKLYAADLEVKMEFDVRKEIYGSVDGAVSSACLNKDRRKLLVGTRGSEIYELSTLDESDLNKGPLVTGHCAGCLKAVACHPILAELATVGDDKTLRTWDLESHKQLRKLDLDDKSRALGFLPNGHEVAVGLGAEGEDSANAGRVLVVSMLKPELEVVKELKDCSAPITVVGFAPDGECLAAGAADYKIYIFDALNSYALKCVCEGHAEVPRTLDFSIDSLHVLSCTAGPAFEMLVHDGKTGEAKPEGPTELADEAWDAWTATLGYGVLGAYENGAEFSGDSPRPRRGGAAATLRRPRPRRDPAATDSPRPRRDRPPQVPGVFVFHRRRGVLPVVGQEVAGGRGSLRHRRVVPLALRQAQGAF